LWLNNGIKKGSLHYFSPLSKLKMLFQLFRIDEILDKNLQITMTGYDIPNQPQSDNKDECLVNIKLIIYIRCLLLLDCEQELR
jgi:hypothetical protein